MSDFIVSARKYRPVRFSDVVGQQHITTTLRNAIRNGQLAHSFLFCGPRGVGKTTCARILAQSINCENPVDGVEPCGQCGPCKSFRESSSFNIYEIDAASNNSVEDIRALTDQVRFPPQAGRYKVYIIDEVHMLSQAAFNAFLKTLEEPPSYAVFILATTEKHKIIPTIISRCQIFDFNRIRVADISAHLQGICDAEEIPFDQQGLQVIAQKADGGMRDALSLFDRIVAFSGGKVQLPDVLDNLNILDYDVFFGLVEGFLSEDLASVLHEFQRVLERGFDGDIFLSGLSEHLRNLLVAREPATHDLLELSDDLRQRYIAQASLLGASFLVSALSLLNQADIHYRASRHKRLHVETTLVKLTYLNRAVDLSAQSPVALKKKQPTERVAHREAGQPDTLPVKQEVSPPPEAAAPSPTPVLPAPPPEAAAPSPTPVLPAPPPEAAAPKTTPRGSSIAGGIKVPSLRELNQSVKEQKQARRDQAQKNAESDERLPDAPDLSEDQLEAFREHWKGVVVHFEQINRMSIAKMLESARLAAGEKGALHILVHNVIQQDMLRNELPVYRENLSKSGISIPPIQVIVDADPADQGPNIPFSAQDKLARMSQKNPLLNQLREQLGLELEF